MVHNREDNEKEYNKGKRHIWRRLQGGEERSECGMREGQGSKGESKRREREREGGEEKVKWETKTLYEMYRG